MINGTLSPVEGAKLYARLGFSPIPLPKGQKGPVIPNWQELRIQEDGVDDYFKPDNNVGIVLGKPSGGLVDIDLDAPEAQNLWGLIINPYGKRPLVSGRDGVATHLWLKCADQQTRQFIDPVRQRSDDERLRKSAMIVEIRAGDGSHQTMVPPSIHPSGQRIEWLGEPGELPELESDDIERIVGTLAAVVLLVRYWPAGGVRQDTSMAIIGALIRAGGDTWPDQTIKWFWNVVVDVLQAEGRDSPSDAKMRRRLVDDSLRRRDNGQPIRGLNWLREEKIFDPAMIDKLADWLRLGRTGPTYADYRDDMIERHHVVSWGGKMCVMTRKWHPGMGRWVWETQTFDEFKQLYINKLVDVPKGNKIVPTNLGLAYLQDQTRPQFDGVILSAKEDTPGYLNLWRGFAFEPEPGDWSLMQEHMLTNICGGDQELYGYLIGWMAWKVQNPTKVPGVALVMHGEKGIGKNVFAEAYMGLFGQNGFITDSHEQIMGRFNDHLQDVCVLVADEAFWAGDRRHEGVLKGLITSSHRAFEGKGKKALQAENHAGLIVLSNAEFVVPATEGERRFAVFEVGSMHKQDYPYFAAIHDQMENGGKAAMLHDLQTMDLSDFNVRKAPQTAGLVGQVLANLDPIPAWIMTCLGLEEIAGMEMPVAWERGDAGGTFEIRKTVLYNAYLAWRKATGRNSRAESPPKFGLDLRHWLNWPGDKKTIAARRYLPVENKSQKEQVGVNILPELLTAREMFEQHVGGEVDWYTGDWAEDAPDEGELKQGGGGEQPQDDADEWGGDIPFA